MEEINTYTDNTIAYFDPFMKNFTQITKKYSESYP